MTIHQEHERIEPPVNVEAGEAAEPCASCGAPLAHDQRYCLNCGHRRAGARLPFTEVLEQRFRRDAAPVAPSAPARWPFTPAMTAAGVALLALALALGVLIGGAGDDTAPVAAAPPPQVISVTGAGAAAPAEEFTSDWPEGQDGYTVQLQKLPKDGTAVSVVDAAKSGAQGKGAPDVGALDSDDFSSLDGGSYVIYSGVFDSKKQAKKELRGLKSEFPGARVVQVSAGGGLASEGDAGALSGKKSATVGKKQLEELKNLSPEEYQKKAKKLPDETKLPGKAPPKDNKEPGGGGGGDVIE